MIKYPLASSTWDEKEIEAIQNVINNGMFTMGENVKSFEHNFAQYVGSKYCVMVNSGSSANLLAIAALFYRKENPLKRGDEVIVPAVSWATTYYPLYQYGLKLKFVDIDLHTLNFDLDALELAITSKTKAIFAVNLLGNPNEYLAIQAIIKDKDIILLEDNCESLGAEYNGKQAGTIGLMGTFSSFFSHHISTMEGGMIVTDNEELFHILLSIRSHGWTRHLPDNNLVSGKKSEHAFDESFRFVLPGYNVRPVEMCGAIGNEQIKKLPEFISFRRRNADTFKELFSNHDLFMIQREIGASSWFGFSLIIRPDLTLERSTVTGVLSENGIEVRPIVAGNFAKNEVVRYFDYEIHGNLTNAEIIDHNGLYIGNHQYDIEEKLHYLNNVLGGMVR
jgi:CDP-4-dehydro-6-deoxyglucose reductase, E1